MWVEIETLVYSIWYTGAQDDAKSSTNNKMFLFVGISPI